MAWRFWEQEDFNVLHFEMGQNINSINLVEEDSSFISHLP